MCVREANDFFLCDEDLKKITHIKLKYIPAT